MTALMPEPVGVTHRLAAGATPVAPTVIAPEIAAAASRRVAGPSCSGYAPVYIASIAAA